MPNYYEVLGVDQNATQTEIRHAYLELVKNHHPDRNPGDVESATKTMQLINEAYSVLKDPVKRLEYDMSLTLSSAAGSEPVGEEFYIPECRCERCGKLDSSVRATIFLWVLSLLVVTFRRGWGGVLCSRCRLKYSVLFNLEVCLLGWWGFPWGVIFSIDALVRNSIGGIQPKEVNAALLASVCYHLYRQERYLEAFDAGQLSAKLQPNAYLEALLEQIRPFVQDYRPNTAAFQRFALLSANIALFTLLAGLVISFSQRAEQETGSGNLTELIELRKETEEVICKLSGYLKQCLPFETAHELSRAIYVYKMDYTKLDSGVISGFCKEIRDKLPKAQNYVRLAKEEMLSYSEGKRRELLQALENEICFIAAASFNAQVLASGIRIIDELENKSQISEGEISKLASMLDEYQIRRWLYASGYYGPFLSLLELLRNTAQGLERVKEIASILSALRSEIEADEVAIRQMQLDLDFAFAYDDANSYNSLVDQHNALVRRYQWNVSVYDANVNEANRILKWLSQLDLAQAFNDCLHPNVLFREFDRVDLGKTQGNVAN